MSKISLKVLSKEDVAQLLDLDSILTITEEVFERFGHGDIYSPPKESLPLQDKSAPGMHWINSMPAFLKYEDIVGIKWVNVTSENIHRNLPVTMGVILLNDAITGLPIAIVDGTWITHIRTGASSAIGAKLFARKNSKIITLVGCGAEGLTNLLATCKYFDFKEIRLVDINPNAISDLTSKLPAELQAIVSAYDSVEQAVKESDIILLTTTAQIPLMKAEWAKPGDYISTISCFADIDPSFVQKADKLYMDDKECATKRVRMMSGVQCADEDVFGDICEVVAGKIPARENDEEIIVYTPAGMGAVDVGVALEAFRRYSQLQEQTEVVLANQV